MVSVGRQGTIPLWGVFFLESLVVAGALVGVILVLILEQHADFHETLFRRLMLRHLNARDSFLATVFQEEALMNALVSDLSQNAERRSILVDNTDNLDDLRDFYNGGMNVLQYARRATYIGQYVRSPTTRVMYNGAEVPFYNLAVARVGGEVVLSKNSSWIMLAVPPADNSVHYPLTNLSNQLFSALVPFDSAASLFPVIDPNDSTERGCREWTAAKVLYDLQTMSLLQAYLVSLAGTPRSPITNVSDYLGHGMTIVVDLSNAIPLVKQLSLSTESTTVLFDNRERTILAGQVNFGELIDPVTVAPYILPNTPDAVLNAAFYKLDSQCGVKVVSTCNSSVFAMDLEGVKYIVSAIRITTSTRLNMFLLQYNRKSDLFSAFEVNTVRGIVIGIVAAVVVVATCVGIWIAIVRPIARLQRQMEMASSMFNHEAMDDVAAYQTSVLSEVSALQASFIAMNDKLLQARPYLPQALLITADDDKDQDESEMAGSGSGSALGSSYKTTAVSQEMEYPIQKRASQDSNITEPSRHTSTRQSPTNSPVGAPIRNTTAYRRIAMLVVNAKGFHSATSGLTPQEIQSVVSCLVSAVEGAVRNERGLVDSFHGDHFVVSFNTIRPVRVALRNAALCALRVESAVSQQTPFRRVSMGLAEGHTLVGNMGNTNIMRLCAVGPVCGLAVLLETVAQANPVRLGSEGPSGGCGCIVSEASARELESHVHSNVIGWVSWRSVRHELYGKKENTPVAVSVLRSRVTFEDEEWMYFTHRSNHSDSLRNVVQFLSQGVLQCVEGARDDSTPGQSSNSMPPFLGEEADIKKDGTFMAFKRNLLSHSDAVVSELRCRARTHLVHVSSPKEDAVELEGALPGTPWNGPTHTVVTAEGSYAETMSAVESSSLSVDAVPSSSSNISHDDQVSISRQNIKAQTPLLASLHQQLCSVPNPANPFRFYSYPSLTLEEEYVLQVVDAVERFGGFPQLLNALHLQS